MPGTGRAGLHVWDLLFLFPLGGPHAYPRTPVFRSSSFYYFRNAQPGADRVIEGRRGGKDQKMNNSPVAIVIMTDQPTSHAQSLAANPPWIDHKPLNTGRNNSNSNT